MRDGDKARLGGSPLLSGVAERVVGGAVSRDSNRGEGGCLAV